jgi:hypothetical protein
VVDVSQVMIDHTIIHVRNEVRYSYNCTKILVFLSMKLELPYPLLFVSPCLSSKRCFLFPLSIVRKPKIEFVSPTAGHSERVFCSSVTKVAEFMFLQTSHSPLTITTETLRLSITGEKHTVTCSQHILTYSSSPSLPPCYVVRCFERS